MTGDGLYKRPGSPFWYFKMSRGDGKYREVSTKTTKYKEAMQIKRATLDEAEKGLLPGELARVRFKDAAEVYLRDAALHLKDSSIKKERFFLQRPLCAFGDLPCERITAIHITDLQRSMKSDGRENSYINLVVGVASRVLKKAKIWRRIEEDVMRLKERQKPVARVLTEEQKRQLLIVASSKPAWLVAYACALITTKTTMRGCELKYLRWSDVDLFEQVVSLPDSKSLAGLRRIPLMHDAMRGFQLLRERAELLGTASAKHYVLPACEHGHIRSDSHQKTWRTAWRSLTVAAGLKGLRFHDLRHQCVTELAERGIHDQTILSIAGHVSQRMLNHYSHIRLQAKRDALAAICKTDEETEIVQKPVLN